MKNMFFASSAFFLAAILAAPAQADNRQKFNESSPLQLRGGTLVLREWQDDKHYGDKDLVLKINGKNKKVIKLAAMGCESLTGPYPIGEIDVVALNQPTSGCGNATGDASTVTLLTVDKSGNVTPGSMEGEEATRLSFDCDGLEESPLVSPSSVKFKCLTREGRRTKSTFFTFENGRITSSRR